MEKASGSGGLNAAEGFYRWIEDRFFRNSGEPYPDVLWTSTEMCRAIESAGTIIQREEHMALYEVTIVDKPSKKLQDEGKDMVVVVSEMLEAPNEATAGFRAAKIPVGDLADGYRREVYCRPL